MYSKVTAKPPTEWRGFTEEAGYEAGVQGSGQRNQCYASEARGSQACADNAKKLPCFASREDCPSLPTPGGFPERRAYKNSLTWMPFPLPLRANECALHLNSGFPESQLSDNGPIPNLALDYYLHDWLVPKQARYSAPRSRWIGVCAFNRLPLLKHTVQGPTAPLHRQALPLAGSPISLPQLRGSILSLTAPPPPPPYFTSSHAPHSPFW